MSSPLSEPPTSVDATTTTSPPHQNEASTIKLAPTRTKKAVKEQQRICEQFCATDLDEDENDAPTGVKGMKWETLSVKNLHTVCARLGFKGYKNANKVGISY
jgi:hypothetical protein